MDPEMDDHTELEMPSRGESGLSWRVAGPTQQQWRDIKDAFTRLYIGENRRLRDVRAILSKTHNFNASEKMFKRRINDWKIHKNYKAKEKELLAKRVKACVEAGQDIHSISFRGRPVKLDRVKRHYRSDQRFAQIWEQLSQSPDDTSLAEIQLKEESPSTLTTTTASKTAHDSSSSPEFPRIFVNGPNDYESPAIMHPILPPTDLYDIELALFQTEEAVQWQFTAFTPLKSRELQSRFPNMIPEEVITGQTDQVSAFWLGLYRGFDYFQTGRGAAAWSIFDTCCNMVQPLIYSAPLQLFSCLLVHFATPWQGMADLEQHLLGFVSSMAESSLGEHHPLAKALGRLTAANLRGHVVESMMQMVVQGYGAHRKSNNSSLFALRVDQIDMLRKRKNFRQAQYLCQSLIGDSQSMSPKRYRTALAALGRLYVAQSETLAVESVAHRILQHETSDSGSTNSSSAAWACDQLATICMERGEHKSAERYLRRATGMRCASLPHRGPSTASFVRRLELCMKEQGRHLDFDATPMDLNVPYIGATCLGTM